jgi:hypothetical protein
MKATALSLVDSSSLQKPSRRRRPRRAPIQRVAIIGSGIAGLSVAHALSNSPVLKKSAQDTIAAAVAAATAASAPAASTRDDGDVIIPSLPDFEVSMFDSRASFDKNSGAGVQLNGGLSVLHKINPSVCQAVMAAGLPQTKLTSKCRSWQAKQQEDDSSDNHSNNTKKAYPMDTLLELDIRKIVENSGQDVAQSLLLQGDDDNNAAGKEGEAKEKALLWIAIMRNSIQQALLDTLPANVKNRLAYGKYLTNIQTSNSNNGDGGDGGGAYCEFADGTTAGPFDLIVGCDGIQSACKEFLERGKISSRKTKRGQGSAAAGNDGVGGAIYSGVRIKYAVRDGKSDDGNFNEQQHRQPTVASLSQSFGNGAYVFQGEFGAGAGALPTRCTYLIYQDPDYFGPFPLRKDNNKDDKVQVSTTTSHNTNNPADENADWTQNIPKSDLQAAREKMTQQAHDAKIDIGPIVATADRIFELGVYFHNPFSFTGWSKEYVANNNVKSDSHDGGDVPSSSSTLVLCGDGT